jgi:hypothetical protein
LGQGVAKARDALQALQARLAAATQAQEWDEVAALDVQIKKYEEIEKKGRTKKSLDSAAAGNHHKLDRCH